MKTFLQWLEAIQVSNQTKVKNKIGKVLPPASINPSTSKNVIRASSVIG